jgi:hypothetical protein
LPPIGEENADMSESHIGGWIRHTASNGESSSVAASAAHVLSLAAAPTFAIMALMTGILEMGPTDLLCAATQRASPLNGMVVMYALMGAFHAAPWLKLISRRAS